MIDSSCRLMDEVVIRGRKVLRLLSFEEGTLLKLVEAKRTHA